MAFWQSKRQQQLTKRELKEQAIIRKSEHRFALEYVYKSRDITLAIAKMSCFRSFNLYREDRSRPTPEMADLVMIGVVGEPDRGGKRVYCQIGFNNQKREDEFVGSCTLTHLGMDERRESYQRALMLQVLIWDADGRRRSEAYEYLRVAAVSHNRFCHFRISTEVANMDDAATLMRERGYGPTLKLREFAFSPTIVLPNTPSWGWNREEW